MIISANAGDIQNFAVIARDDGDGVSVTEGDTGNLIVIVNDDVFMT